MAYRKDEGRYARMIAFWSLALLMAFGCIGGLQYKIGQWMGTGDSVLVEQFPLLGTLKTSTVIALVILVVVCLVIYSLLNRPRAADALVDTETEMRKVTWPTFGETWAGTVAVIITVVVLLLFLSVADYALLKLIQLAIGRTA